MFNYLVCIALLILYFITNNYQVIIAASLFGIGGAIACNERPSITNTFNKNDK